MHTSPLSHLRSIVHLALAALLIASLSVPALAANSSAALAWQPTADDSSTALWMSRVLTRYHLTPTPFNEALSEKVFQRYLNELDPEHACLTQADLDQYAASRSKLGEAVNNEDLGLPFGLYKLLTERLQERYAFTRQELTRVPDFTLDERIATKPRDWAATPAQLPALWRKSIKRDWLQLRLLGESDSAIASALGRRNETAFQRLSNTRHGDVLALFLNAYVKSFDPHGSFQAPQEPADNNTPASPSLTGLGFTWRMTDGFPTLFGKTIPPNSLDALLQLDYGDRLLGVAQGANGPMESIIGYSLSDVMNRLRGAAGSIVVLDILPASAGIQGSRRRVILTRQPIPKEALEASSTITTLSVNGKPQRVGIITLPRFYEDFAARKRGEDFQSSTRDVAKLLQGLRAAGVNKVLLDLRRNEGGALLDVVSMTRMFVSEGPLGQQVGDKIEVFNPRAAADLAPWDGALAVLISRHSAAGAEIFAAAIQDYGRGLILGESSYANGTVHTGLSLDRFAKDPRTKYGILQLTVSQHYRNSGKSIQIHGVAPDIDLPVTIDASATGEALLENALPGSERAALDYQPTGDFSAILPRLRSQHEARMRYDISLQKLQALAAQFAAQGKKDTVSLNEVDRRKELAEAERQFKALDAAGVVNLDAAVLQEAARILVDAHEPTGR